MSETIVYMVYELGTECISLTAIRAAASARRSFPDLRRELESASRAYLAVWNLGGEHEVEIPIPDLSPKLEKIAYPA